MEPLRCWDSSILRADLLPASKSPPSPPACWARAFPEWPESSQGIGGWAALIAPTPRPCHSWAGLSLFLLLFPFIWNGPWPSPPPASAHLVQAPSIRSPAQGIPARSLMDGEQAAEARVPVLPSEGRW